jgi:plasmid maintenance system antidote protein VapI
MSTVKSINSMFYPDICELLKKEVGVMESQSKVATKCGVSVATISNMVNGKWESISDSLWRKVAVSLGWRPDRWTTVETYNLRYVHGILADAQERSLWLAISDMAGAGKSRGAQTYFEQHRTTTYYLECDEWNKGEFIKRLARTLGISHLGCGTYYDLLDKIISEFAEKADQKPLIIFDQADKLRDAAVRCLITLFNGLEDRAGVVIMGVGHLSKKIRRSAELQVSGYDEILSRFGRVFLDLPGSPYADVAAICQANGLTDQPTIKMVWKEVYEQDKTFANIGGKQYRVVKDLRRLKKVIQRELLNMTEVQADELEDEPVDAEQPAEAVAA